MLKLNQEEADLFISELKDQLKVSDKVEIQTGEKTVNATRSVKNLDVCFDTSLTMERWAHTMFSGCCYHILNTGHIRQHIMADDCRISTHILHTDGTFAEYRTLKPD